jgi:cyanophycinase
MGIHLIGGGWAEDESEWTGRFVAEAASRAGRSPVLTIVLWAETPAEGAGWHQDYVDDFARLGAGRCRIVQLTPDRPLAPEDLDGADAIFVGGGVTPGYHAAVMPAAATIRALVLAGVPYGGFSAGAMIAGETALLGGWRIGGRPIAPQERAEGLDEVTLADGLGLVDFVVDAHTGHGGLLGRVVGIVDAGLAERVVGIDECTSVIVVGDNLEVAGQGCAWVASRADERVAVQVLRRAPITRVAPRPSKE